MKPYATTYQERLLERIAKGLEGIKEELSRINDREDVKTRPSVVKFGDSGITFYPYDPDTREQIEDYIEGQEKLEEM